MQYCSKMQSAGFANGSYARCIIYANCTGYAKRIIYAKRVTQIVQKIFFCYAICSYAKWSYAKRWQPLTLRVLPHSCRYLLRRVVSVMNGTSARSSRRTTSSSTTTYKDGIRS